CSRLLRLDCACNMHTWSTNNERKCGVRHELT
ncbi:hypothetical protein PRIPAC_70424, partial [Pristionchus pacificus]